MEFLEKGRWRIEEACCCCFRISSNILQKRHPSSSLFSAPAPAPPGALIPIPIPSAPWHCSLVHQRHLRGTQLLLCLCPLRAVSAQSEEAEGSVCGTAGSRPPLQGPSPDACPLLVATQTDFPSALISLMFTESHCSWNWFYCF